VIYVERLEQYPPLPEEITAEVYLSLETGPRCVMKEYGSDKNYWVPCNQLLQDWLDKNISSTIAWSVGIAHDGIHLHTDLGVPGGRKFYYLIQPGGPDVITSWYDKNGNTVWQEKFEPHVWYGIKVDLLHDSTLYSGNVRIILSGRLKRIDEI